VYDFAMIVGNDLNNANAGAKIYEENMKWKENDSCDETRNDDDADDDDDDDYDWVV
jgi:hypothetical protein